jgi:hypothetical protein
MYIFPYDFTGLVVTGLNTNLLSPKQVVFRYSSATKTELIVDFVKLFERIGPF